MKRGAPERQAWVGCRWEPRARNRAAVRAPSSLTRAMPIGLPWPNGRTALSPF